ncbi:hypothetical protein ABEX29_01150 [Brevibacillus porteri]|uniref:hypothetical protein n=1 Tax=Brevibacillus porteri TaxID=2126350 RepID=UPI003D1B007C
MNLGTLLNKLPGRSTTKPASNVQAWIPIQDIEQYHMLRQDKWYVAGIRVYPTNIDLLSRRERNAIIQNLREVVNGLSSHFQIFCTGRPVDLDGYISHLEQLKANTTDPIRKKILQSQIKEAAQTAISGEALETLFFMLFTSQNKMELLEQVKQILVEMKNRGIGGHILDHKELMDMNFIFTHPVQAAYERMPEDTKDYIPPQLLNPERMKLHG